MTLSVFPSAVFGKDAKSDSSLRKANQASAVVYLTVKKVLHMYSS